MQPTSSTFSREFPALKLGRAEPGLSKPLTPVPDMFSSLPVDVAGMVRDEANLSMARLSVLEAIEAAKAERRAREKSLPFWRLVTSAVERRRRRNDLRALNRRLRVLGDLLARVQGVTQRLAPALRASLVQHLGIIDPAYRQGVRAARFHEHWTRHHSILSERLVGFQRDLKEAKLAVVEDCKKGRDRLSAHSRWCVSQAHQAASDLEKAAAELLHTAGLYEATVDETPFAEVKLPKIELWNCITPLFRLSEKRPAEALTDLMLLIQDYGENKPAVVQTIKTLFRESAAMHSALAEDRLNSSWGELRRYAETHLIYEGEISEIVLEIEHRQQEAERARYLRQMKTSPYLAGH